MRSKLKTPAETIGLVSLWNIHYCFVLYVPTLPAFKNLAIFGDVYALF